LPVAELRLDRIRRSERYHYDIVTDHDHKRHQHDKHDLGDDHYIDRGGRGDYDRAGRGAYDRAGRTYHDRAWR
jgi:hypothetical protein